MGRGTLRSEVVRREVIKEPKRGRINRKCVWKIAKTKCE